MENTKDKLKDSKGKHLLRLVQNMNKQMVCRKSVGKCLLKIPRINCTCKLLNIRNESELPRQQINLIPWLLLFVHLRAF